MLIKKRVGESMNNSTSVGVHRCEWCGKPVTETPESLNTIKEISILCSDCLDWEVDKKTGGLNITIKGLVIQ